MDSGGHNDGPGQTLSPTGAFAYHRAGDRARTGDPQLGKLMLYQLSYSRVGVKSSAGHEAVNKTTGGPAEAGPPVISACSGRGQFARYP